jgi:hypothetical protein
MANKDTQISQILLINTFVKNQQAKLASKQRLKTFREANKETNDLAGIPDPYDNVINQAKQLRKLNNNKLTYPLDLVGNPEYDTFMRFEVNKRTVTKEAKSAKGNTNQKKAEINGKTLTNILTTIDLYNPGNLNVKYDRDWSEEELGTITSIILNNGGDPRNVGSALGSKISEQLKEAAGSATGINIQAITNKRAGRAINPGVEVLFKGIGYREFQFQFTFSPRSESEVTEVMAIMKSFKYHSAPDFSSDRFFFTYPSTYKISFFQKNKRNDNLFSFAECGLTSIDIDYSPNSVWSTFISGHPVSVTMTLSFKELELISKSKIAEKNY